MPLHPLSKRSLSLDAYRNGKWLVFDLETTNVNFGSALEEGNRVVMVAWKMRGERPRYFYGSLLEARDFWEDLERADYLVAHNAKFEALWLRRLGYDITSRLWYDTMLGEYVRLGNRRNTLNLGDVSKRYGFEGKEEIVDSMMKSGVCPSQIPEDKLIARCLRDIRTTEQVLRRQLKGLTRSNRLHIQLTRCLLTPILAEMEGVGVHLDAERVNEEYAKYRKEHAELMAEMDKMTGGINWNSGPQRARFLYETLKFPEKKNARGEPLRNKPTKQFPDGVPKTDKGTMEWLMTKARTKKQKRYVEMHQKLNQIHHALAKNLEYFKGIVDERDSVFYGVFNQTRTRTHRLSSSGSPVKFEQFDREKSVQLQNMPRIFKRLFSARHADYRMVETDGSQLEFRVAAYCGQDAQAMEDIRNPDFDAHVTSAAVMNSLPYDDLLQRVRDGDKEAKALRTGAKFHTFKPLFGGKHGTEAQERWYREFQRRYHELYETQEGWLSDVLTGGKVVTPWGMRFYWNFYLDRNGTAKSFGEHKPIGPQVFNCPIQSLATAEIIPIALVYLWYRVRQEGLRVLFVNTVHDSVICEVHKEDIDRYREIAVQAFTHDVYEYLCRVYGIRFNVPLGCETCVGTHWSEGDEYAVDVEPPFTEAKEAA